MTNISMKKKTKKTKKINKINKIKRIGGRNSKRRKIKWGGYDTYAYDDRDMMYYGDRDIYRDRDRYRDRYRDTYGSDMSNLARTDKSQQGEDKMVEGKKAEEDEEEKTPKLKETELMDWYIGLSGDVPYLYKKERGCENEEKRMIASVEKIEKKRFTLVKKRLYIGSIDREKMILYDDREKYILQKKNGCAKFKMKGKKKQVGPYIEPKAVNKLRKLFKSTNERVIFDRHWKNNSVKKIFKNAFKKSKKIFNIFGKNQ